MDGQKLNDDAILALGHQALIQALGAAGALHFLQLQQGGPTKFGQADGRKRLGVRVGVQGNEAVVVNFSEPVTWLRLEGGEALDFASKIRQGAQSLTSKPAIESN